MLELIQDAYTWKYFTSNFMQIPRVNLGLLYFNQQKKVFLRVNFHHVSKIRQTFSQMNNVFNATSKIEMSSPITYHGFHLQHEVHNNHLFIVIWAQPERMCSRNRSLNLFICREFIQMGGLTTLQGSTQTLHSSKLQVEEPSTPRVQNETEKTLCSEL